MPEYLSCAEVARYLGVNPKTVTNAFYNGWLRSDLCPVYGQRRLVPRDYVCEIQRILRSRGKLPADGSRETVCE